MNETVWFVNK